MPQYPPLRQRHHTTNSALVRRLIWEEARREKLTALEPTQKGEPT